MSSRDALAYRHMAGLLADPWRSPSAVRRLQERKLRRLVAHAYRHVPFYREVLDSARVKPRDIRTLEDLQSLPVVDKAQLRDAAEAEKTADNVDLARCQSFSTSGSTGIPLRSYFTREDSRIKNLSWIRSYVHCGVNPFSRIAAFVGDKAPRTSRSWYERLGLWRRRLVSTWDPPESWVLSLRAWRPRVYLGYVMTLTLLAEFLERNDIRDVRPRRVLHTSAILEAPARRYLESRFGCRVTDLYGSDEGGCLAWECPKCGGYHINSDTALLEILKDGRPARPGEDGEVVLTNLHSRAMPFIRYRQDDIVRRSSRAPVCGRRFPLLESIQGRKDDFIVLPSGPKLSPHAFYYALDFVPGVRRWRITQETPTRLRVEIARGPELGPDRLASIARELGDIVRGEIKVEIVLVDDIRVDAGRKFRAVNSRVGGSGS